MLNQLAQSIRRKGKDIKRTIVYRSDYEMRQFNQKIGTISRKLLFLLRLIKAAPALRSRRGQRFLELSYLFKDFLSNRIDNNTEYAKSIASQLLNVLEHCDEISYEEPGTAEAYALLHFLDRYHRFQLIFDSLNAHNLMPIKPKRIDILDIGTGPGPSMYAISDFYMSIQRKLETTIVNRNSDGFSIDYVERSEEFRSWLHHFTEHANFYCPSGKPWKVPYHHGSFLEFQRMEFNQTVFGSFGARNHTVKYRFDVIIFSNFLTTKEQVENFSTELRECVRFLRNNGILIVVGARSLSKKYSAVYDELSNIILSENYNNWNFIASCEKLRLENSILSYSWNDHYGQIVKGFIGDMYKRIQVASENSIPAEMVRILDETIQPDYSRSIEWEVHVFRKKAKPRRKVIRRDIAKH